MNIIEALESKIKAEKILQELTSDAKAVFTKLDGEAAMVAHALLTTFNHAAAAVKADLASVAIDADLKKIVQDATGLVEKMYGEIKAEAAKADAGVKEELAKV